jgi:hypothetical protein
MEQQPSDLQPADEHRDHGGDIALSTIMMAGIGGTAILVVIILLVRGLFVNTLQQENYSKVIQQKPVELLQLREQELSRINSYTWLDREHGVVSIPIEQAMALAAARLRVVQRQPVSTPVPAPVVETIVEPGADVEALPAAPPADAGPGGQAGAG